jgi:hypothetical protein
MNRKVERFIYNLVQENNEKLSCIISDTLSEELLDQLIFYFKKYLKENDVYYGDSVIDSLKEAYETIIEELKDRD